MNFLEIVFAYNRKLQLLGRTCSTIVEIINVSHQIVLQILLLVHPESKTLHKGRTNMCNANVKIYNVPLKTTCHIKINIYISHSVT